MTPLLEVSQLNKSFLDEACIFTAKKKPVLTEVSFCLYPRQTLAIMGPNNAGKSTLGRLIAGILPPDSGEIKLNGQLLQYGDYTHRAKHIRVISPDPNLSLNPRLNVGQVLDIPLKMLTPFDEQERNRKIFSTLHAVGLYPDHANIKIAQLSTSQKQRVALARAIILNPEVIIIDQALSTMDSSIKTQLVNIILELQEHQDIAYIYIGQHLGIIKHISDTVLVLDKGKIVEYGATQSVLLNPQQAITQKMIQAHFGHPLDSSAWQTD